VLLVDPLYHLLQFLLAIESLEETDEKSDGVFQGIVMPIYSIEDQKCIFVLSARIEDIGPFEEDLAKDSALVVLDLLGEAKGSGKGKQSLLLLPAQQ
jgi:hypothetical protein